MKSVFSGACSCYISVPLPVLSCHSQTRHSLFSLGSRGVPTMAASSESSSSSGTNGGGKQVLELPCGYRFCPEDDEAILYLKHRILNMPLPADIIATTDVFNTNPDQLTVDEFKYGMENEWYFFAYKPQHNLFTQDGYWKSISEDEEIFYGNQVVGFMQRLTFYQGRPPNGLKTDWLMHEYRLNPHTLTAREVDMVIRQKMTRFVLCKVFIEKPESP